MNSIKSIKLTILSPQDINRYSFGEITNHKALNTRTFKPELGGLFDPRIFGPFLNYECYCGKYKGKENSGQKCERCEVLISEKNLQRWRMGHIALPSPVTNIAIFKILATNLSKLLGIPSKRLEDIIYLRAYVVLDNGTTSLLRKGEILERRIDKPLISSILQEIIQTKELSKSVIKAAEELNEKIGEEDNNKRVIETVFLEDYLDFLAKHRGIKIGTGTEAFQELLNRVNIKEELERVKNSLQEGPNKINQGKLRFLQALQRTSIKLEWMIIKNLPVIPCGLRPVTKLKEEDTIATTQTNNLFYKILLIKERLNYYFDLNKNSEIFFSDIINNEKRRLQKAVDQTIYGSTYRQNEIKSLLQNLSGKEGILRRYSLGKRVDYSARSVIVPNPNLLLDQIGLPVKMGLTLYKPFIIQKILKEKIAFTIPEAERLFYQEAPIVFSLLSKIVQDHPILANRAPSLHRLSIQGFYPQLTLGNSIELHPLITTGLNADFDGDQMAIYLPMTTKSCEEVKERVLSSHHIVDPKNGYLIDIPSQDMILGIYYLTREIKEKKVIFYDQIENILKSHEGGKIGLHDLVVIPAILVGRDFSTAQNQFLFTTLGKIIFNQILPDSFSHYVNDLQKYNEEINQNKEETIEIEKVEKRWKDYQPLEGWKKKDIVVFLNKLVKITPRTEMVKFLDQLKEIGFDYATYSGISISPFELEEIINKQKNLTAAKKKTEEVEDHFAQGFYSEVEKKQKKIMIWEECKESLQDQLVTNLEKKNNTSFYHIWNSGARASSESLTQIFAMRGNTTNYLGEVIETPITSSLWEGLSPFEFFISVYGAIKGMIDIALKTAEAGYLTRRLVEASQILSITSFDCGTDAGILVVEGDKSLKKVVYGRYLAQDISDKRGKIVLTRNTLLLEKEIEIIWENKITEAWIFSPLTCELVNTLCQKCYGLDLSRPGEAIALGTAVGVIAAQSLGEPGTQLTMRTFHSGGITGDEDITQGLPKVKQIFDNISPEKNEKTILAKDDGKIISVEEKIIKQRNDKGQEIIYSFGKEKKVRVSQGDTVKKGERLTGGKVDLEEYLEIMGRDMCQKYIKEEVKKVYDSQGIDIDEKHIEIFARQMLSRVEVVDGGDSEYLAGEIANYQQLTKVNKSLLDSKKSPISFKNIISSLKDLASYPDSFLAGISFQNTLKSLVNYSLYQPVDYLRGCKENLIAGQLIPVGTGFKEREKFQKRKRA